MRLAHLRHRLLIAMGLPACWTSQVPEPAPAAPKPVAESFDPGACVRDTIPETVCGVREEELGRCGPRGDSLASYDENKLYVTDEDGEKTTFRRFVFDRKATLDYRTLLGADGLALHEHCCYSRCTPLVVARSAPPERRGRETTTRCMPRPPGGTSAPAPTDKSCPNAVRFNDALAPFSSTVDKTCCYAVPVRWHEMRAIPGRPARVEGEARFASVGAVPAGSGGGSGGGGGAAWGAPGVAPMVAELPRALRDRLAAVWVEAARAEHASIASFANLSLRLLVLGAPPDLVAGAHAAALDEIRHAQVAFELASAYAGEALQPVRFDDAARMSAAGSLADLAIETLLDGCINETIAAVEAETAGEHAADPAVASALREIADDEARHAELAWRIVAWCVRTGEPGLVAALHEAAAAAGASLAAAPAASPAADSAADSADLAAYGVLGPDAQLAARAGVLRDVVAPCLAALAA
jgi:hypothetical protein